MKNQNPFDSAAELAPVVQVKGEVTSTNFHAIRDMIRSGLKTLNLEPKTDDEFGQAEQDCKSLKIVETGLKTAKEEALKQAAEIQALFAEIDETSEECRQARLSLEKAVKTQKDKIRQDIVDETLDSLNALNKHYYRSRVDESLKGKRTLASLHEAAKKERIQINAEIDGARKIIDRYKSDHGESIALDNAKLELMGTEALEVELSGRVQRLAAEAARKKAESEAAEAKAEADQAKREAEALSQPAKPKDPLKVEAIPVGMPVDPAAQRAQEWEVFKAAFFAALAPVKAASDALKVSANQRKALRLRTAINTAWKEINA